MNKTDINNIYNLISSSRKVVNEAAPMQSPSAMTGGGNFRSSTFNANNANSFNTPQAMASSQTQTNNMNPNVANQNMQSQLTALDQKLTNMTNTLDNITILLGKLIAPSGRSGTVAPSTAPSNLGFRPTA